MPSVMALVLSHEAALPMLESCLRSVVGQDLPSRRVVVVDNGSSQPVSAAVRGFEDGLAERVEVVRLPENLGPAGGYAEALSLFLASDLDLAWLLDDDCVAAPTALRQLVAAAGDASAPVLVRPRVSEVGSEERLATQGWCGALLARPIVEAVGLPNSELVWWTEDTEYLQWRIPAAGFPAREVAAARLRVHRSRPSYSKPAWKFYYESRNMIHYRLHTQRPTRGGPHPRHLRLRVRGYRAAKSFLKLLFRAAIFETDRLHKVPAVVRGAADGLRGRLGMTVPLTSPDRPRIASEESQG